jgi:hypothetical protein
MINILCSIFFYKGNCTISWIVSNCNPRYVHSDRDVFVRKLQSYLKVDVYGQCGTLQVDLYFFFDFYTQYMRPGLHPHPPPVEN